MRTWLQGLLRADRLLLLVPLLVAVAGLVLGTLVLAVHFDEPWPPLMWAGACLSCGLLVGFLFGIPKVLQETAPVAVAPAGATAPAAGAPGRGYRQVLNTNLEQVSDWLTKIIVGVGLVELRRLPDHLDRAATLVATGAGDPVGDHSIATALILYFSIAGFLGAYLATRLHLARAFALADQAAQQTLGEILGMLDVEARATVTRAHAADTADGAAAASPLPTAEERVVAERVAKRASELDPGSLEDELAKLVAEFERLHTQDPRGAARLSERERVVAKMRLLGLACWDMLPRLVGSRSLGQRMAALAFLQLRPDPHHHAWIADRFREEASRFVVYHAGLALLHAAEQASTTDELKRLRELHARAKEAYARFARPGGSETASLLDKVERALQAAPTDAPAAG